MTVREPGGTTLLCLGRGEREGDTPGGLLVAAHIHSHTLTHYSSVFAHTHIQLATITTGASVV